jgi:hypothetical protein
VARFRKTSKLKKTLTFDDDIVRVADYGILPCFKNFVFKEVLFIQYVLLKFGRLIDIGLESGLWVGSGVRVQQCDIISHYL